MRGRGWFVLAGVSALVVLLLAVTHVGDSRPGGWDGWVPAAEGLWHSVALVVDFGGEPLGAAGVLAALVVAAVVTGRRWLAVFAVLGPAVAVGVTVVLKPLVGRTIHGPENLSFPSGHTASATAFALVLAVLLARGPAGTLVIAAVVGGAMAWSQVSLGAHYETDTLGGFCTTLAVMPAVVWALERVRSKVGGSPVPG